MHTQGDTAKRAKTRAATYRMNHRRGAMHVKDSWAEARTEAITLSKKSNRGKQRNQQA